MPISTPLPVARRALSIALLGIVAACARAPRPELRSTPGEASPGEIAQAGLLSSESTSLSMADLDRRIAEVFGDTRFESGIPVPSDSGAFLDVATWDIDVESYETQTQVQRYVAIYTGEGRDRFAERLARGARYEPMIRQKLRNADLPEDMYYLALVESGFNPHAYSRAAAVGMWQFMTSTARGVGLRVDWWVDERRDPVRSTDGAVRFLGSLREQFGSMYLAAAAYNGGPGRIARGLSQHADDAEGTSGDDLFFLLSKKKAIATETREYVPQLIASALVAKEAGRYGIAFDSVAPFAYDSVRVGPRTALASIAKASGTTVAALQDLNPHILRGMTPPVDSFQVRLPAGTRARFDSVFTAMEPEAVAGARVVKAAKNATWASLGREYGVSARWVSSYNPTVKASRQTGRLPAGRSLLVPTPAAIAAMLPVPNPAIEKYGSSSRTHIVRRGENLSVIARRYRTTSAAIMRLNRLKKALILPGQELRVRP